MDRKALDRLNRINKEFYQEFAGSFARTRERIQPGVSSILKTIPKTGNWLDVGCGNGNLARAWVRAELSGFFYGVDFSPGLIAEAEQNAIPEIDGQELLFRQVDLTGEEWIHTLPGVEWDGIFCFAVLHHIPGSSQRKKLCLKLRQLLKDGFSCYISVWQPRNSLRLSRRIIPWENIGLSPGEFDPGDVLMDWKEHMQGGTGKQALRYVHIFSERELTELAADNGFAVIKTWYSDGKEGNLSLYQRWIADF